MLLSLGMFQFSISTAAYAELSHRTQARFATNDRLGARASVQYLGPGAEEVELSGAIMPPIAGALSALDDLRAMQDQGTSWPLVAGTGAVLGSFVIERVENRGTLFFPDGTPRRVDFSLSLLRTDDPAQPAAGAVTPAAA